VTYRQPQCGFGVLDGLRMDTGPFRQVGDRVFGVGRFDHRSHSCMSRGRTLVIAPRLPLRIFPSGDGGGREGVFGVVTISASLRGLLTAQKASDVLPVFYVLAGERQPDPRTREAPPIPFIGYVNHLKR
jgi:hypothetical protein